MRHLATIRVIKELRPIPNADRIELAIIDGWQCVVSKSDGFKVGDKVIYVEIDSILPPKPEFEFMKDRKYRVKTIKLRGQISQGLVLPTSLIPHFNTIACPTGTEEGSDVTSYLGITKYDPEAEQEKVWYLKLGFKKVEFPWWLKPFKRIKFIREWWINKHKTITSFPPFITKTDEERIQNLPIVFDRLRYGEIPLHVTEKIDGTSATYFYKDGQFGVCSRNRWILKDDGSPYWKVAEKYEIRTILENIARCNCSKLVVLQGEIIGSNIQGNKYCINGYELRAFNLILNGVRLEYERMKSLLRFTLIDCVPEIGYVTIPDSWEIQDLVENAKGKSLLMKNLEREGIVCRNERHNISFKVINPNFLLKEGE